MTDSELLSKSEAARRLGISPQTLQRMIENHEIAAIKVRFRWKIRRDVLEAYLRDRQQ